MYVSIPVSAIFYLVQSLNILLSTHHPSLINLPYFMIARKILCHLWWYTLTEMHGSNTYRYSEGSTVFLFASSSLESAAKFTKQGYSSTTCILVKKKQTKKTTTTISTVPAKAKIVKRQAFHYLITGSRNSKIQKKMV